MLGNAVPVNLGRYVGRCIQDYVAEAGGVVEMSGPRCGAEKL